MKCRNFGMKVERGTQYCPNCRMEHNTKARAYVKEDQQKNPIFDDALYVQQQLDQALVRESRIKKALIISCVTMAILLIGMIPGIPEVLSSAALIIVMIGNIVAIAMSGLKASGSMLPKLLKGSWLLLPFPYDLAVGPCLALFLIMVALFVPAPFIFGDFCQNRKLQKEARNYLSVCA